MEEAAVENYCMQKEKLMSDQILAEQQKIPAANSTAPAVKTENGSASCAVPGKGWIKGTLGMAICCGTPLLLLAAIAFFGLSLRAIASGALSLMAVLACPVGMFLMMRMMMKDKK
jgi:hypothetical protein